jgi:hypothetical protein
MSEGFTHYLLRHKAEEGYYSFAVPVFKTPTNLLIKTWMEHKAAVNFKIIQVQNSNPWRSAFNNQSASLI